MYCSYMEQRKFVFESIIKDLLKGETCNILYNILI